MYSALTEFVWECRDQVTSHASHRYCKSALSERRVDFEVEISTADGCVAASMRGVGVAITQWDFDGWRSKARNALPTLQQTDYPTLAPPEAVGLPADGMSFVTYPVATDAGFTLAAQV